MEVAGRGGRSDASQPKLPRRSWGPAIARDALIAALFVVMILGSVWGYTGQPFPSRAPLVVVESGSMMRPDAAFGRLDSIEPGDLVLVKRVGGREQVRTSDAGRGAEAYGARGDVIIYRPYGDPLRTPIIHRAVAWVEVVETGEEPLYTVREWGQVLVPALNFAPRHVRDWRPEHEGFVTQGDNPATNPRPDQVTAPMLSPPVRPEWILGKAQGEIPWVGLLKLAISGTPPPPAEGWCKIFLASAPCDSWAMLGVSVLGLVLLPLAWEPLASRIGRRR